MLCGLSQSSGRGRKGSEDFLEKQQSLQKKLELIKIQV